ncbi:hypothetical protein DWR58_21735, partial [Salmonella enterica]|nr:hypothetical protein [Salmonella enterica]
MVTGGDVVPSAGARYAASFSSFFSTLAGYRWFFLSICSFFPFFISGVFFMQKRKFLTPEEVSLLLD